MWNEFKKNMTMKHPDLILVGDLHLRENTPFCRKDNFIETLCEKLTWLKNIQSYHNNPLILFPGDIFHSHKPSFYLLNLIFECFPIYSVIIPGNHDLPFHNLNLYLRSGLSILEHFLNHWNLNHWNRSIISVATKPTRIVECGGDVLLTLLPFGSEPKDFESIEIKGKMTLQTGYKEVLLVHEYVFEPDRPPFPGCDYIDANQLLDKYPGMDLIVAGDNHMPVYFEREGRKVICPGSFTRQTFDQYDYQPKIWFWYKKTNHIESIDIPIKPAEDVFHNPDDSQVVRVLDTFNEFLEATMNATVHEYDFFEMLKKYMSSKKFKNQYDKRVAEKILEAITENDPHSTSY